MPTDNLYDLPALPIEEEFISILAEDKAVRIERIISTGQISGWFDQEEWEFVTLLQGRAELTWADGSTTSLSAGDALTIPPHRRHRVSYTSTQRPCIWLCVFWPSAG